jgi:hypothetical protein
MKWIAPAVFGATLLSSGLLGCTEGEGGARKVTMLSRDDHDVHFPIKTGKHGGIDCNKCHGAFDTFKLFDCLGCHADSATTPKHAGVSGYSWDSPSCYSCHPRGVSDGPGGVDHTKIFPIAAGDKHQNIACSSCHADPASRKNVSCTVCHDAARCDPVHVDVGGYQWTSGTCLRCHADSQVSRVTAHTPFGLTGTFKHYRSSCLTCHPGMRTDKAFGEDFKSLDCTGCHTQAKTDPFHVGIVTGYAWDTGQCILCHPDGTKGSAQFNHPSFPISSAAAPPDKHAGLACTDCHADPASHKNVTCAGCHHDQPTMDSKHANVGGYAYLSVTCLRCHADSQVKRTAAHLPFGLGSTFKHFQASCLVCHPQMRADKPFGEDFNTRDCLSCHTQAKTDPGHVGIVAGYVWSTPSCIVCHPDGTATTVDHTKIFPIATGDKHQNIVCTTCHVDPANRKNVSCANACHDTATMQTKHKSNVNVGGYAYTSATCVRCHADSQVDRIATHSGCAITPGHDHSGESCLKCHPNMRTDKPFGEDWTTHTCTACHGNKSSCN